MAKRVEIITKEEIAERIGQIAAEISAEYENRSPVFLGVLKGAFMFLADLVRELSIPVEIDFVWLSSYGDDTASSGKVRLHTLPRMDLRGRDVIVVEDIVDTGHSMAFLKNYLQTEQQVASIKICTLLDKPERREVAVTTDYAAFRDVEGYAVGYGLDCADRYRELPSVYRLDI